MFDMFRSMGTKMSARAVVWLTEKLTHYATADGTYVRYISLYLTLSSSGTVLAEDPDTACVLGVRTREIRFQPVQGLKLETDFKYR